jgi:hypothetical protein
MGTAIHSKLMKAATALQKTDILLVEETQPKQKKCKKCEAKTTSASTHALKRAEETV